MRSKSRRFRVTKVRWRWNATPASQISDEEGCRRTPQRANTFQRSEKCVVRLNGFAWPLARGRDRLSRAKHDPQRILHKSTQRLTVPTGSLLGQTQKLFIHIKDCLHKAKV